MGERIIINMPTKQHWKKPSRYEYIEGGLIALKSYLQNNPVQSLSIPALGCGNGGMDWTKVRPMIEQALVGLEIPVWIYEPVKQFAGISGGGTNVPPGCAPGFRCGRSKEKTRVGISLTLPFQKWNRLQTPEAGSITCRKAATRFGRAAYRQKVEVF